MYGLEDWTPKDFDFGEFAKGLASIQAMPLCLGCLNGDGRPNCEIRACTLNENVSDCSECASLQSVRTLKCWRKCAQVRARQVFVSRLRTLIDSDS